jgi:hypothetical protein
MARIPLDVPLQIAYPSASVPESWADWPEDRIRCQDCGHRSGFRCIALNSSTHLPELLHRCEKFVPRIKRLPE